MVTKSDGKTVFKTEGTELTITRVFDAPRELVFDAFSDAERLKKWWGPREWPTTYCTVDFRVGGVWIFCMTGPDGTESWGRGDYEEIVRPERIVYVDAFADKDGNVNESMPRTRITMTFTEDGGKTKLESHSVYGTSAELEQLKAMGMVEGITETWDRLEEFLAAAKS
jgi:uncharacterized protein YndB with AHSA1/START domain